MASPKELDLFNRSLGGDRRARTELYKKYIFSNARIRGLGKEYSSVNDFLHDCLNNLLRTGHSWKTEGRLQDWVESVAVWTAMAANRPREIESPGMQGQIRMCAEIEGEDAIHGELMAAYCPPALGDKDSPLGRILGLLTDAEQIVFRKRAVENATWEQTASAATKPLNAAGPIFARVIAKVARLFGAPPPADDDLVPVVSRVFADPSTPEGRAVSLQLDTTFFDLRPDLQSIGLKTVDEARSVVLWEAASIAAQPEGDLARHLSKCRYCEATLRSLRLLREAVAAPAGTPFLLCPGAFTLVNAPEMTHAALDQHLALCPTCRDERSQLLQGRLTSGAAAESPKTAHGKAMFAAGAVLLVCLLSAAGYFLFGRHERTTVEADTNGTPAVAPDSRYRDLMEDVPLDNAKILTSVLPGNREAMRYVLSQYSLNNWPTALAASEQISRKGNDPGAQMVYAMSLYRTGLLSDAYREMLKSEQMQPREPLRCWVMMQFALGVGDRSIAEREAQHLANDPEYGQRAQRVLAGIRSRG